MNQSCSRLTAVRTKPTTLRAAERQIENKHDAKKVYNDKTMPDEDLVSASDQDQLIHNKALLLIQKALKYPHKRSIVT